MIIDYRPATSNDACSLEHLLEELGYSVSSAEIPTRLNAIRQRQGEVFVALNDQQIVGCVHVMIELRMAEGESGEIASLVVDSQFRGAGIGDGLLNQCRLWLDARNIATLKVRMNSKRTRTHPFYIKQGLSESKTQTVFVASLASLASRIDK